ncbi:MAG: 6-phosphogluconate dehydrogenase (decarboxylating) [Deltaproteobacteria bacterium GWB2_55_19]|nr:MAG: 6-phosphogluconate dehydrogenase (decarboxylating) [Deltaproteobacteria bacterium GWB2_55_19]
MRIGMVGLGRMGMNMALRLVQDGHVVTAFDRSSERTKKAEGLGIKGAYTLEALASALPSPKAVWLMVPAGEAVDSTIAVLKKGLAPGDIIIDGGNSFYKDSLRRHKDLAAIGIHFIDAGVSGGIWGLTEGYCIMAGGEAAVCGLIGPIFKSLAQEGGYLRCGGPGSGHFVKMAHNGIEYGLMEAYAEGFELMKASGYGEELDLKNIARLWMRGSVVRSWLLELLETALSRDPGLSAISGFVEDSGEGRWTVKEALDLSVSLPVITEALFRRFRSRQDDSFAEKVLAALRKEFGGHSVKSEGE